MAVSVSNQNRKRFKWRRYYLTRQENLDEIPDQTVKQGNFSLICGSGLIFMGKMSQTG